MSAYEELKARLRDASNGQHDMTPHCGDLLDAIAAIEALEAKLAQAQEDANWAYVTAALEDNATEITECEAKLAQAAEGLEAVVQHETSTFFGPDGEKNKRASWRGVMRKVRATLATIKGDKP